MAIERRQRAKPKRRPCPICGKQVAWGQVTCSRACFITRRMSALRDPRPCLICKKQFWPRRYSNGLWMKCCSNACEFKRRALKNPPLEGLKCTACNASIPRRAGSHRRKSKSGRFFCSHQCRGAFMRGVNSPFYRGTEDPNRGAGWKRLSASIRDRDGHACKRCGRQWVSGPKFPVDHILPWRSFANKEEANDPANLVTVCRPCHTRKTVVAERKWLKGDRIGMEQYRRSLTLPSEVRGETE